MGGQTFTSTLEGLQSVSLKPRIKAAFAKEKLSGPPGTCCASCLCIILAFEPLQVPLLPT